jgi:hypothetical protein
MTARSVAWALLVVAVAAFLIVESAAVWLLLLWVVVTVWLWTRRAPDS